LLWIDLTSPSLEELSLINDEFGFHPLAMEDAAKRHQRPKIDACENFLFIVFYEFDIVDDRPLSRELRATVPEITP
jgi:magnesium transporter